MKDIFKKKLDMANVADRTQYYSSKFKKVRCKIQEYGQYQPCRMFIENTIAIEITMSAVKHKQLFLRVNLELKT